MKDVPEPTVVFTGGGLTKTRIVVRDCHYLGDVQYNYKRNNK